MLTLETFALVMGTFLLAGSIKGVVGLGLPTVSLALLSTLLGHKEAMALILVPSLLTNAWQGLAGGYLAMLTKRLWGLLLASAIGTVLATAFLARADPLVLTGLFGIVLTLYAGYSLLTPQIRPPKRAWEGWLSPLMGGLGGIATGYLGSFIIPGLLYLQALGLPRDQLVQALGMSFLVLTLALGAGMAQHALLTSDLIVLSASALVPAVIGMNLGQRIRHRLPEARFRQVLFAALLALGLYSMLRAFVL